MYIKIEEDQYWDGHWNHNIYFIEPDNESMIASIVIQFQIDESFDPQFHSFYVQPRYRRMGYARLLFQDALDYMKREGRNTIDLQVRKDNPIKKMYEEFGFEYHSESEDNYEWLVLKIEKDGDNKEI